MGYEWKTKQLKRFFPYKKRLRKTCLINYYYLKLLPLFTLGLQSALEAHLVRDCNVNKKPVGFKET